MSHACVLGSGPFGTALCNALAENCEQVRQWARDPRVVEQINQRHENAKHLPGVTLSPRVRATLSMAEAVGGAELVLFVLPSGALRGVLAEAAPQLRPGVPLVCTSKSIEPGTLFTMSELFQDCLPASLHAGIAILSGPALAKELGKRSPTMVAIAAASAAAAARCQALLQTSYLRLRVEPDLRGVQLGAALKNVIAIAVGISDGLGLGANLRAALITLGLEEIGRLVSGLGGDARTLAGLAGLGDLVLTASGPLSRSWQVGAGLAKSRSMKDILRDLGRDSIEGATTATSVAALAERAGVTLPICRQVQRAVEGASAAQAMRELQAEMFATA